MVRAKEQLAAAEDAEDDELATTVVGRLRGLVAEARECCGIAKRAAAAGEGREVMQALDRVFAGLNLIAGIEKTLGQASGEIPTSSVNVMVQVGDLSDVRNTNPYAVAFREAVALEQQVAAEVARGLLAREAGGVEPACPVVDAVVWEARERVLGGGAVEGSSGG